nr:MAG TPA: hypothetical protein [Caudoviricetes sp.]
MADELRIFGLKTANLLVYTIFRTVVLSGRRGASARIQS